MEIKPYGLQLAVLFRCVCLPQLENPENGLIFFLVYFKCSFLYRLQRTVTLFLAETIGKIDLFFNHDILSSLR